MDVTVEFAALRRGAERHQAFDTTADMLEHHANAGYWYLLNRQGKKAAYRGDLAKILDNATTVHNAGFWKRLRSFLRDDDQIPTEEIPEHMWRAALAVAEDIYTDWSHQRMYIRGLEERVKRAEDQLAIRNAKKGTRKITPAMRAEVFQRDDHRCLLCDATDDLTIDHIVPFVHGGACDIDNFQTLCLSCNIRKNARFLDLRVQPNHSRRGVKTTAGRFLPKEKR